MTHVKVKKVKKELRIQVYVLIDGFSGGLLSGTMHDMQASTK